MPIDPAKPFDLSYPVTPNWVDMRLDHFVKAMVPAMSRTKIQKYIRADRIEVNGTPRPANWRVRLDDIVVLRCQEPENGSDAGKYIPLDILYEDEDIVAINKQSGLVVHPVALHRHDTLLNALYWRYKDVLPPEQEISLANRLDRNTSGVILVSKHTQSKRHLQDQFENRKTVKSYLALCEGHVSPCSGVIDLPLGPGEGEDRCRIVVRHDAEGKPSRTNYEVIEHVSASGLTFTLVGLAPHTGRQHQLRVHMAALGYPLVGDDRYGDPTPLHVDNNGQTATVARYALHARALRFIHPRTNKAMTITAPLAPDIQIALDALRSGGHAYRAEGRFH